MKRWCCMLLLVLLVGCTAEPAEPTAPLSLDYYGTSLTVGMTEEAVLTALGEPLAVSEADSCAGQGKDLMYTYPSLRLYVFAPVGGTATLTSLLYTDDGPDTKGVRIGTTCAYAMEMLGEPTEQSETALVYRRDGVSLTLSLRDGCVSAMVLSE